MAWVNLHIKLLYGLYYQKVHFTMGFDADGCCGKSAANGVAVVKPGMAAGRAE